ncbi:MAG TPA: hypothetical protein P5055_13020, partial [Candidatus Paceibacterota bacterium]|nr:hypothetical protein [Candidatus Paceibacterota bacterium]
AVEFLLQAAQRLFDGFAFPDLHFCHTGVFTCLMCGYPAWWRGRRHGGGRPEKRAKTREIGGGLSTTNNSGCR